jgi:pimeloyl-ACP methyl ester carboxylesterase
MPVAHVNGTKLQYESHGSGDPLVLVHGSWVDRHSWDFVVPLLSSSYRVISFDRRGHSVEEGGRAQGTIHDDMADVEELMGELGATPAHVVGNSMGASISLNLAAKSPELFRSLAVHEPPLLHLLREEQGAPRETGADFEKRIAAVCEVLASGDSSGGAKLFVENVAIGPGMWDVLPKEVQDTFVRNAPTFLQENQDPNAFTVDLDALGRFDKPLLLSEGDQSPAFFSPIVAVLRREIPAAPYHLFPGQGHVPHFTDPNGYVEVVKSFLAET